MMTDHHPEADIPGFTRSFTRFTMIMKRNDSRQLHALHDDQETSRSQLHAELHALHAEQQMHHFTRRFTPSFTQLHAKTKTPGHSFTRASRGSFTLTPPKGGEGQHPADREAPTPPTQDEQRQETP